MNIAPLLITPAILALGSTAHLAAADRLPSWDLRGHLGGAPGIDSFDGTSVEANGGTTFDIGVVYTHPFHQQFGVIANAGLFSTQHKADVEGFAGELSYQAVGIDLGFGLAYFASERTTIEARLIGAFGSGKGNDIVTGSDTYTDDGGAYRSLGMAVGALYTFGGGFQIGGELRYTKATGATDYTLQGQSQDSGDVEAAGPSLGISLGFRF